MPHATLTPDSATQQAPPTVMVLAAPRRSGAPLLATTVALLGLLAAVFAALLVANGRSNPAGAPSLRAAQVAGTTAHHTSLASLTSTSGVAAAPAAAEAPAAAPAAKSVMIMNYAFSPASLTIPTGTTVTWTNDDDAPHTVTSSSGPAKLDSPQLAKGDTWSFTFTKPGTYSYYCAVHPDMKGTVTVTSGSSSPAPSHAPSSPASSPAAPSSAPPSSTGAMGGMPSGSGASCTDVADAVAQPFETHFDHGHLEESPAQQVADILNVSQYVKTHTVLVEAMLQPLYLLAPAVAQSADAFVQHVYHGHLEESPSQQAADILNPDQYAKTHTVMIENMAKPLTGFALGSC